LKSNDDEKEDEIDLSKGEDRERYVTNKEGNKELLKQIINSFFLNYFI